MKALIIAAGKGNRLRKFDGDLPKPLHKVAGLSLIERAILSGKKAGITEFVVVIGYQGSRIQDFLEKKQKKLGVALTFVKNENWERPNGHSVLSAQPFLNENFILLMADHIFDWEILEHLQKGKPQEGEVVLAVDERVDDVFDLEDATKVKGREGHILEIGKRLEDYNTIDTGIFYCSRGIFSALERACQNGEGCLSEAIGLLASTGKARVFPIGRHFWQDVDTPEGLHHAEKVLLSTTTKDTDGPISKYFNRRISGFLTRFLVKTPLGPNQITWSALIIGLLSGFFIAKGTYFNVALGGLVFQFASIYDGCDGEVAKLKMASTKFGEWLDTICDNITYLAFIIGLLVGVYHQGFEYVVPLGLFTVFGILMTLTVMYFYLIRFTNSGSLVTIQKDLARDLEAYDQNLLIRFVTKIKFMMKRDFFALFFMVLCLFNRLDAILILAAIGSNVTWMVFLAMKREFAEPARSNAELTHN